VTLAERYGVRVRRVAKEELSAVAGHRHHQGVAIRTPSFPYADPDAFLSRVCDALDPLIALDCLQDPQNVGAILRSGCFLGARGVVVPKDRAAPVTAAVVKVAAGATAYLPVVRVTNLVRALEKIKERGIWVVGLDAAGDVSLYDIDLTVPLALVVGGEHAGLRPLVQRACDWLARIPGGGPLTSLNAAVAAAVALAEVQRQRRARATAPFGADSR
jgi:23S rRNA (guanosine2251-2'-O)-methyltransferase